MNIRRQKIKPLIEALDRLINDLKHTEFDHQNLLDEVSSLNYKSARNLIHYRALRKNDLRELQKKLRNLGMSRFARSEAHVMASLLNTQLILNSLIDSHKRKGTKAGLSIKNGRKTLTRNTKNLLGFRSRGRRVRIMVTQPAESACDYQLVHSMIKNGMNCARINCAHDSPEIWLKIITNIKKASHSLHKKVQICMDLAGPKIRTGEIAPGPKVKKFSPVRDEFGKVINPAIIAFIPNSITNISDNELPVDLNWFLDLQNGDELYLNDTRNKERRLTVFKKQEKKALAYCQDTSYVSTGTEVINKPINHHTLVGELPPIEQSILLRKGDHLIVHKEDRLGEPAMHDEKGSITMPAHISCQLPEVFDAVRIGEPILFDDGKIEGIIEEVNREEFTVRITRAKEMGTKLKAEKGINFPTTSINVSGLTKKDKEDLKFIVEHADIVNFSFVNTPRDIEELLQALKILNTPKSLGIILKIETQKSYDNLIDILLTSMKVHKLGVMIARGDLAVETGWEQIGKVQKEILSICSAAHVPVVWATQVLENLAKKGLPSRSEITDATNSLKAECVMLNKGAYINDAIILLNKILSSMERFKEKNDSMLPQLEKLNHTNSLSPSKNH